MWRFWLIQTFDFLSLSFQKIKFDIQVKFSFFFTVFFRFNPKSLWGGGSMLFWQILKGTPFWVCCIFINMFFENSNTRILFIPLTPFPSVCICVWVKCNLILKSMDWETLGCLTRFCSTIQNWLCSTTGRSRFWKKKFIHQLG